jgi:periplasmic protein CpxP/Spy
MSRPWMGYLAGAAFVLSAAAAATAYAQAEPGDHARAERQERTVIIRRGDGDEADAMYVRHGGAHVDAAEHLRTMLQLKPSQEPALAAYLAAVKPAHEHEHMVEMSDRHDAKTTPQRLAEMEAQMAQHTAAMHGRIEATKRFYDQLEPSQKKVFDELPMLMIGPMGPMKVMVNMEHMPSMPAPPTPPAPPKAPPAPHS